MKKKFESKKGMTVIEVILSLAILGIVTVPLMTVFASSLYMTKHVDNQIEVNMATRLAKELVTYSVNNGSELAGLTSGTLNMRTFMNDYNKESNKNTWGETIKCKIIDSTGKENDKYYFVVRYQHTLLHGAIDESNTNNGAYGTSDLILVLKRIEDNRVVNTVRFTVDY